MKMSSARICGSLVAAVVGDCIGALFECSGAVVMEEVLHAVKDIEQKWAVAEKKKSGPIVKLPYTDDTAMARCIAASIINKKSVDVQDIGRRFAEEFDKEPGRGYGGNVTTVLRALSDPNLQDMFQPAREQFNGSGSYGNGGGMRISPLALYCSGKPLADLQEQTVGVTRLTHSHPHAIVGSILQAFAVRLSLAADNTQMLDPEAFLDRLLEHMRVVERDVYLQHKAQQSDNPEEEEEDEIYMPYCNKLELMKDFLTRNVDTEEIEETLGTDISALKSVPTAVYCFLKGASGSIPGVEERSPVEQTVMYAISLGGDTDTIATMAGAIAGAFYGLKSVPKSWQDSCEGVEDAILWGEKMVELINTGKSS